MDRLTRLVRPCFTSRKLTASDVVSHRFRFEQIAEVYKRFDQKQGGIEKVFLEVSHIFFGRYGAADNFRPDMQRLERLDRLYSRMSGKINEVQIECLRCCVAWMIEQVSRQ
jgi:hypothetical protein